MCQNNDQVTRHAVLRRRALRINFAHLGSLTRIFIVLGISRVLNKNRILQEQQPYSRSASLYCFSASWYYRRHYHKLRHIFTPCYYEDTTYNSVSMRKGPIQ